MFERFTDNAKRVLGQATALAEAEHSAYLRRHHLLFALLEDAEARADAITAAMFADASIDVPAFRSVVLESLRNSEQPRQGISGHLGYSSGAKKSLELALREALSLGHNYVGCEHLILAVLRSADGPLASTLGATALTYGTAREFLRTYGPHVGRGRERGRRSVREVRFGGPGRRTDAIDEVLARAVSRAGNERALNTGDLLVALTESNGTHFAALVAGASLPNASDLAAAADALVEANAPDGAPDPVRVDPRTGVVTVIDPVLAAMMRERFEKGTVLPQTIADAIRKSLQDG